MRILIDMQGAQSESRFRGIGRYTMSLALAIARNAGEHEIWLTLNSAFPESVVDIREAFKGLIPQEHIRVFETPLPVRQEEPSNKARAEIAESIREYFLEQLNPDIVLVTSLFEGYVDDAIVSVGQFSNIKTAVTIHDFIPLIQSDMYLQNETYKAFYMNKLKQIQKADLFLSVSESSKQEAIDVVKINETKIHVVSNATDKSYIPISLAENEQKNFLNKYHITKKTVLYAPGGFDTRKNFERLIQAFARLPKKSREQYQLVIVSKIQEGNRTHLENIAKDAGLKKDEFVLTGYVSDDDLKKFYSLCELFVFPSLHEGFGLPVLEAMACGAAVIGSNTTSVPEVIGLDKALFDPCSIESISQKMEEALSNEAFRLELKEHALVQTKKFSWDESAKKALKIMQTQHSSSAINKNIIQEIASKVISNNIESDSELHQISSSIAKNSHNSNTRQLLLDVSEIYHNDAGTGVQRVVKSYLKELIENPLKDFITRPVYARREESYRYTNKFFESSSQFFDDEEPMVVQRGDIFFALDMQHHVQLAHEQTYLQMIQLGVNVYFLLYDLLPIQLAEYFKNDEHKNLHIDLLKLMSKTNGIVSISDTTRVAFNDWVKENKISLSKHFLSEYVHIGADMRSSLALKEFSEQDRKYLQNFKSKITFLAVGTIEPRKAQEQILSAFELLWKKDLDINLVIVGRIGWKMESFLDKLKNHRELNNRLFYFDGISDEYLEQIYKHSSCLIAASINEGFGLPLIEAAHYKLPVIARDIPIFREVAGTGAYYFNNSTHPNAIEKGIEEWLTLYEENKHPNSENINYLSWSQSTNKLKNIFLNNHKIKQIFVDISELIQRDARTGIQRVVRNVLRELLINPPKDYFIEPVYAKEGGNGCFYAREYIAKFLGKDNYAKDTPIEFRAGDLFLGLDMSPSIQIQHKPYYQELKLMGVEVYFIVYDILLLQHPQWWPKGTSDVFEKWMHSISEVSTGLFCISQAVADEVHEWIKMNRAEQNQIPKIESFHLGADIDNSIPSKGIEENSEIVLDEIHRRTTFLMVGTLEPRKGNMQTLEAFEKLWSEKIDVNLVMVGKEGWLVETLIAKIKNHPELNKRLFWLNGISDEYLEKIYQNSTCLIAASEGEGFGLPLIEAAQHKIPIIARDIPVFREVAGEYAYYFINDNSPDVLSDTLKKWLEMYKENTHPKSNEMPWLTWEESTRQLLRCMGITQNNEGETHT